MLNAINAGKQRGSPDAYNACALAARHFHQAEAAALAADDEAAAQASFYRLWSLKEAAAKNREPAAALDLRTPAYTFDPAFRCIEAPSPGHWSFATATHAFDDRHYSLATAIAAAIAEWPRVYRHTPGVTDVPTARSLFWMRTTHSPAGRT